MKEIFSIIAWNVNWDVNAAPDECGEFSSYDTALKKAQKLEDKYDRVRIMLRKVGPQYGENSEAVYSAHRKTSKGLSPGWVRHGRNE